MNREAGRGWQAADAALTKALGAYRARLEPGQLALFDGSEAKWEVYRKAACDFETSGAEGGSAHSMVLAQCLARLDGERLEYLKRLSSCEEGDLSCPRLRSEAESVDIFGYYQPEGPLPAWAQQIDHVLLSTVDARTGMTRVPLWGLVRMKQQERPDYRIPSARLQGRHLSFATQAVDGVSFAFDGEFARLGNFPIDPPQGLVLQGRLRRLERGRVAGETAARFSYTPGD